MNLLLLVCVDTIVVNLDIRSRKVLKKNSRAGVQKRLTWLFQRSILRLPAVFSDLDFCGEGKYSTLSTFSSTVITLLGWRCTSV